jgi:hypothetical protein
MKTMELDRGRSAPALPEDLRQTAGTCALVEMTLEAAQAVGGQLPRWSGVAEGPFNPRMLLTMLTYCYAAGIYGSEEIEWATGDNPAVRYLCANAYPDWKTIRRFRNANRPWIEECLAWVYGLACGVKAGEEGDANLARFAREKVKFSVLMDTAMAE